jgi:FMN phosphatase YigB (HAD superfamily)
MAVRAVAFDVGETLVDETRYWNEWADWFGIRPFVLNALLGATIALREPHRNVFARARPDLDVDEQFAARRESGRRDMFVEGDLFPDARPCLARLAERGLRTCIAGNQPPWMAAEIRGWRLPVEFVSDAAELDALKPDRRFFVRLLERLRLEPDEVAYVGDRADNDVAPAADVGMVTVLVRRGPWGTLTGGWPEAACARLTIDSLDELPDALTGV